MAVDELLLATAVDEGLATLRLYQWSEPTLSLGYFQPYDERHHHAASRDCAVVRRPSGGGAILHDHELTYSLVLPASSPFARNAEQLYTTVHAAIVNAFSPHVATHSSGWSLQLRSDKNKKRTLIEPFLCFQRQARGDIVLTSNTFNTSDATQTWKILGSAQRRHRGAILQHGSLLIKQSRAAPELPGLIDLTATGVPIEQGLDLLPAYLESALNFAFQTVPFPKNLQPAAEKLMQTKYKSSAWTHRR